PTVDEAKNFEGIAFRKPLNTNNFQQFYAELALTENAEYFVNEHLHSKFIIIDHTLIFCTYNFTPTQFIYLDKVKIPRFKNMPKLSYEGIHCEVGMHVIIEDEHILKLFEEHIAMLKNDPDT